MHVAVCDDNVADRKQMERLLHRESDKRLKETGEGLFIDSYGNEKAVLSHPMLYDVFYIDMCKTPGTTGIDVVNNLLSLGVVVPIYMCVSDIDYRTAGLPGQVKFLNKAIKAAELAASLDDAQQYKDSSTPLIELREEKDTVYVTEEDILYAMQEGRYVDVTLKDGRNVRIRDNILNLFSQWEHYETFFAPTEYVLLNGRYIKSFSLLKLTMIDGRAFRLPFNAKPYAKAMYEKYVLKKEN